MNVTDESASALAVTNKSKHCTSNASQKSVQNNRQSMECFYCRKKG